MKEKKNKIDRLRTITELGGWEEGRKRGRKKKQQRERKKGIQGERKEK